MITVKRPFACKKCLWAGVYVVPKTAAPDLRCKRGCGPVNFQTGTGDDAKVMIVTAIKHHEEKLVITTGI